jgi:hypothetical protein
MLVAHAMALGLGCQAWVVPSQVGESLTASVDVATGPSYTGPSVRCPR